MPSKPLDELQSLVDETRHTVDEFRIERGKVAEFAAAIHAENPIHYDPAVARDRGYSDVVAPLTFARAAYFPHNRPDGVGVGLGFDLGFARDRVVHGEQGFEYERPLVAGDVLDGETTLADVYQRESSRAGTLTFAVYETRFRDREDGHVLTTTNTRVETERVIEGADD